MAERAVAGTLRRTVIGVGNPDRGDDGVGALVADLLRGRVPEDVEVAALDGEVTSLLARLESVDVAYLIDAAVAGGPAGAVRRFDCIDGPLPERALHVSTHGFGPAVALELARACGRLPAQCVVYAIEAASVAPGAGISDAVGASAEVVAAQIAAELWARDRAPGASPA